MLDADGNYTIIRRKSAIWPSYSDGRAGIFFRFLEVDYLVSNQSALWGSQSGVDYTYSFYEYYTLEEIARDRGDCSWMEAYN